MEFAEKELNLCGDCGCPRGKSIMSDNKEEIFITNDGELVVEEMSTNGTGMLSRRLRPGDYIGEILAEDLKSIGKFELSY